MDESSSSPQVFDVHYWYRNFGSSTWTKKYWSVEASTGEIAKNKVKHLLWEDDTVVEFTIVNINEQKKDKNHA